MIESVPVRTLPIEVKGESEVILGNRTQAHEPLAEHLRRLALAAGTVVSPFVAILLLTGRYRLALSMIGGAIVSFALFAMLRIVVYKALGMMADDRSAAAKPASMAVFGVAALGKFGAAIALVYGMVLLHANLLLVLAGFVVAQIALAVTVSRGLKGPVS